MYVMMFMKMFVAVKTLDTAGGGAVAGRGSDPWWTVEMG